ncbi:MAG TPA: YitT family protein [Ornithinibacter sp.]|nr:YitT family protein [Ornithinibacter sp.]
MSLSPPAIERAAPGTPLAPPHTLLEDVAGVVTGAFLASLGLFVLASGGVTTGGTAGLSLLLAHTAGWPFAVTFLVVSLPLVGLAIRGKGWPFTVRSAAALAMVSLFAGLQPRLLGVATIDPLYAALVGNLLAGVGILVVFRHRSSLGGFNVVALLCQERLGWRAGYVQMGLDLMVVLAFAAVSDVGLALASAAGAVLLNLVIAMNHRPGRYTGG